MNRGWNFSVRVNALNWFGSGCWMTRVTAPCDPPLAMLLLAPFSGFLPRTITHSSHQAIHRSTHASLDPPKSSNLQFNAPTWSTSSNKSHWFSRLSHDDRLDVEQLRALEQDTLSPRLLQAFANRWLSWDDTNVFELSHDMEQVLVRPLWVGVHQEMHQGNAKLFVSILPIDNDFGRVLLSESEPQVTLCGYTFENCDGRVGNWSNFFIGAVGDLDMWPNRVYHQDRFAVNLTGYEDVMEFLADPTKERIEMHSNNAKELQRFRGYKDGWSYYRLRDRWGEDTLREHKIKV